MIGISFEIPNNYGSYIRKNAFDNGYLNIKSIYKINETFRAFEAIN